MSWFDATGLASIAKSALKEAQKTIDKALDIKDTDFTATPTNTPIDTNDDFFGTWGLTQPGGTISEGSRVDASEISSRSNVTTSLWGSFTGSFFETSKDSKNNDSLDDSRSDLINKEYFSQSKLIVQGSNDDDAPDENVFHKTVITQEDVGEVLDISQSK